MLRNAEFPGGIQSPFRSGKVRVASSFVDKKNTRL